MENAASTKVLDLSYELGEGSVSNELRITVQGC